MQTLQEYKCPCCGGAIAFDSTLQKMKCPYCDTEFEMEALEGYDAELQSEKSDNMEWETSAGGDWQEGETDGLRSYVCKSCGGEIVGDANTAATACPFCGNPVVMMGQFSGALKPDLVIPFKLDKKAAKAGLMKHLTGEAAAAKDFQGSEPYRRDQGCLCTLLAFRHRCGRTGALSCHKGPHMERQRLRLHRNQPLYGASGRQRRL